MSDFNERDERDLADLLDPDAAQRRASALEQSELKRAHRIARLKKYKTPLIAISGTVVMGVAVVGVKTLAGQANKRLDNVVLAAKINNATDPALLSVEGLRAHGACEAELLAESKVEAARAKDFAEINTDEKTRGIIAVSGRFKVAASLAAKYSVSCEPAESGQYSLTPLFDVPTMRSNKLCEDELQFASKVQDPSSHPNEMLRAQAAFSAHANQIGAELAASQHIPCA